MKVFITDHGSITTRDVILREDSQYPSYVHQIDSFFKRTLKGMRLPTQNMIDALLARFPCLNDIATSGRTGLLVGSGASGWAGTGRTMTHAEPDYSTRLGFLQLINIQAGMVAARLGIKDYLATDATACSSSLKCIEDAMFLIQSGRIDRLLLLGWDDQISSPVLDVFNGLRASLSKECYENGRRPSAFDGKNGGFLIGHGIGFLVIESESVVSSPVAEILSTSNRLEATTNPLAADAKGYKKTMRECLTLADLPGEEINVIKAHGTGTEQNNSAESEAIIDICGVGNIVTSYKPTVGHTMGACGAIETSMLLDDYESNLISKIENRTSADNHFISEDTVPDGPIFMVNAAGMGGVYSTMVGQCIT